MSSTNQIILACAIFLATYVLLIADKIHRTIVGAVVILLVGIITQNRAVEAIDFNTIGLLIGMMVIVGVTRQTGVFEYLAILAAKWAKGEPVKIMLYLATVIAWYQHFWITPPPCC
ncbi:Citrate transporter [Pelotomaculum schinkii]|uniref:Citrate transporter n=1 Tax=Pelotomaculum schinkii TaxID=78350 RepID=A0A4Y7R6Y4_9FIRM|nr:Citrate transporter [Pelotomaculum schinkii]